MYFLKLIFLISTTVGLAVVSCKKTSSTDCYDKEYHEAHKNDICTMDCPGVTGCDGKTYCNECIMHTHGIKKTQ